MGRPGRPPFQITDEVLEKAETYASQGMTEKQISEALGISQETLIKKKKQYSEFVGAIKRGQAAGIEKVTNALFRNATEEDNTTAQIFFLKNRAGWNDGQNQEKQTVEVVIK